MSTATQGNKVKVHYTGKLDDGSVFDSSREKDPFEFTVGKGEVIAGFDEAVAGMEINSSQTVTIAPDKGYGNHKKELVASLPKNELPEGMSPEVGQRLELQKSDGQRIPVRVTEVDDSNITIDANHPLAGKELTFDLELVEIVS